MATLTLEDLTPAQLIAIAKVLEQDQVVISPGDALVAVSTPEPEKVKVFDSPKVEAYIMPTEEETEKDKAALAPEPTAAEVFQAEVIAPPPPTSIESLPPAAEPESTLDAAGLPWDERIHSSAKTKTAKGVWKRKRNLPEHVYDQVVAELTGTAPVEAPVPAPDNVVSMQPQSNVTLPDIMLAVTSGKVDQTTMMNTLNKHGIKAIGLLGARPDLIPVIAKELGL